MNSAPAGLVWKGVFLLGERGGDPLVRLIVARAVWAWRLLWAILSLDQGHAAKSFAVPRRRYATAERRLVIAVRRASAVTVPLPQLTLDGDLLSRLGWHMLRLSRWKGKSPKTAKISCEIRSRNKGDKAL